MSPARFLPALVLALVLAVCTGAGASAGPWARAKDETFLSFSLDLDTEDTNDSYGSVYAEHGLGHRFTLGIDVGGDDRTMSKAIAFLRWTMTAADDTAQVALELGGGVMDDDFALRPGLSLGRGLTLGDRSGWMAIDTRLVIAGDDFDTLLETDLTFGLNATPRRKWIFQVLTGAPSDRSAWVKLAPKVAFERAPGRHILLGVTAGVVEADEIKINLGLWHRF